MIAGFHSAGVTDQYDTGGNLCSSDIVRRTYELRLGGTRALPLLVKVQLVCKAWYKGAGRHLSL